MTTEEQNSFSVGLDLIDRSVTDVEKNDRYSKKNEIIKLQDSAKRFAFLLEQTDLFRHFIDVRAQKDSNFAKLVESCTRDLKKKKFKNANNDKSHRHRKTEQEEDRELLNDEEQGGLDRTVFTESPYYVQGSLRDYQVQGLNWLISLYENGINGILADEMGLGKTLQTISFLGYLKHIRNIDGPHLIAVPKSTMENWFREFARWCPDFNVLLIQGDKEDRAKLINERLITRDFDVCITSYELILREKSQFKKINWEYIVIDEAHRIKNEDSMLSQVVRILFSRNRLLITGTPLQNNMHELWALLNFLLPDVFSDFNTFDDWFHKKNINTEEASDDTIVQQLHKVLSPFLLRRVKADVEKSLKPKIEINLYVGMSQMQVNWYQKILEKDIDAVNGVVGKREGKTRLLNIVMQLRKCCNHPYLFDGAEPGPPYTTDEHLVFNSGKMIVLDKLLKRMKLQGSRVLIFSQMSRVLDILEDFCFMRGYEYCRIDGQTQHEDRTAAIDEYNKPGSTKFLFLLTTRAGGLGINLTTADIVVIYDSDWNPQADLQAMDRAHRIGQNKQVYVFRLVTEKAIEEKVIERAAQKLRLDQLVIQQGKNMKKELIGSSKDDLLQMIQHGAEQIFQKVSGGTVDDENFEEIFRKGEQRTIALNEKYSKLGLGDLQNFASDSAYEWDGKNYKEKQIRPGTNWINPTKRDRGNQQYSIDRVYKGVFKANTKTDKPKTLKYPRQVMVQDHQFFPQRLIDLLDKETAHFRKEANYKVPLSADETISLEDREADRDFEQNEIDIAQPLTEAEKEEKILLLEQGFSDWSRRQFFDFIHACARYGRDNFELIAQDVEGKTAEEIKKYSEVFWKRKNEIEGHQRYIQSVEEGERRLQKLEEASDLLRDKVTAYTTPLQQLKISYFQNKGRMFTEEEDRFIIVKMHEYGLYRADCYERIRDDIRESPLFRFDWFIKSRTPIELQRRGQTLLNCIRKELKEESSSDPRKHVMQSDDTDYDESSARKKGNYGRGNRKASNARKVK